LPIDSEHNAIFQSLPHHYDGNLNNSGIRHLLLTASGGPFRGFTAAELENVTKAQAVAHPNWSMGQKISVDSATLMNKGLELIEACFLFNCQAADVQIVVHPESVIHSMVQYVDGSVIAQMGQPDMRTPIAYAMAWPERIEAGIESLDFFALKQLNFEPADEQTFACLALARQAFNLGGSMPAVLNAANEIAVEAFLQEQIAFSAIATLVAEVMSHHDVVDITCLDDVLNVDAWARQLATTRIAKRIARKVV
ncbi:MAG: 1-deoxy-D-xylulose-5-phosphate reductoisomerase, partial [Oleibacter sp.]|nr:1-deoxy-D-xylulose-5-phosphate reductoisomerase [Thalassolituus sp.]